MRKLFTLLTLIAITYATQAQDFPIEFTSSDEIVNWEMFENGENAPENFVIASNPDNSGINTSDSCLQFTVAADGQPWAGAISSEYGEITITDDNYMLSMLANKDVESRVLIKLEVSQDDFAEVFVENSAVGEWEELVFDFYDFIGKTFVSIVIFPDFPEGMNWGERTESTLSYISNINWYTEPVAIQSNKISVNVYPNPTSDKIVVNHPGITELKISNALGQTVKNDKFSAVNSITTDVSNLKNGLYYITLKTAVGFASSKFVKE